LSQEEVSKLFRAAKVRPVRDQLILAVAYRYAMRTREIMDLPARNVDLVRKEVTIQGAKNGLTRTYTIGSDLLPLFRAYAKQRDDSVAQWFTGRLGRLHRIRLYQIMKETLEAAGLRDDVGLHALRHSSAVHALDAGLGIDDVRDLARHRKISSTEVYANLSTKRRSNYLKVLEESVDIVKMK
jgi:site-specific recombinase XerD